MGHSSSMIVDAHTHPVFLGGYIHPGLNQLSVAHYGQASRWFSKPRSLPA